MGTRFTSAAYRELGRMLRRVRKDAGLTATEVAHRVGWPLQTVSRMENGWRTSVTTDVVQYLVVCGVMAREAQPFLEFTRLAERKQGYYLSDARIGGYLESLIFYETSAERSILYEPQLIHGLLQTPDYARSIITGHDPGITEERLRGAVRTRMERQRILSRPNPGQFIFYIDEHALRRPVGSDQIMHEQLLHLVLTAALDNITVRVVPNAAGERGAFGGAFRLLEFSEHRPIVCLDLIRTGLILDDPDHVNNYSGLQPKLADVAMDEGGSLGFAADLADAYDRGRQRSVAVVNAWPRPNGVHGGGGVESTTPIYE